MKSKTSNTPLSSSFVNGKPTSSAFAASETVRFSGRTYRGSKIRFEGYEVAERPAVNSKAIDVEHIPSLKGNRQSAALFGEERKGVKFTVIDRNTGLPKEVLGHIFLRKIAVLCCGTKFHFSCKAGSQSVLDSRDGKRKPLHYVKSELVRLLGATEGEAKFAELVA